MTKNKIRIQSCAGQHRVEVWLDGVCVVAVTSPTADGIPAIDWDVSADAPPPPPED